MARRRLAGACLFVTLGLLLSLAIGASPASRAVDRTKRDVATGTNSINLAAGGDRDLSAPAPPTNVQASDGTYADFVRVTWDKSAGAVAYRLYRRKSPFGTAILLTTIDGNTYDDYSTAVGSTYWYWVTAGDASGEWSGKSGMDLGHRGAVPSQPPGNVRASDCLSTDRVVIGWDRISSATAYEVWRSADLTGDKTRLGSTTLAFFHDTTGTANATYYYWVKACNLVGCTSFSDYDTGQRCGPSLPAPANLQASDGAYPDKVQITWDAVTGANHYKVHRAGSATGSRMLIGTPNSASFADTSITPASTYYYWAQACSMFSCSDDSDYDTGHARAGERHYVYLPLVLR